MAAAKCTSNKKPDKKRRQPRGVSKSAQDKELPRLREDLAATREPVQAIIKEQEATNEELATLNDELELVNNDLHNPLALSQGRQVVERERWLA